MTSEEEDRGNCPGCGAELKCPGCDDIRPQASKIDEDWKILSPLGRWETVKKVKAGKYGDVLIWTDKTGPDLPWMYWGERHVDAQRPETAGTPIVRIVEIGYADGGMYAIATHDRDWSGSRTSENKLVEATFISRSRGWTVTRRSTGMDPIVTSHSSKADARSALRTAAREMAKTLGVEMVLPERSTR